MGDAGYRGVSATSDPRFRDKEAKALKQLEAKKAFPANFANRVDLRKCNLQVVRPWVEQRVNELLGFEDDVVAEYVLGILESDENQPHPDPRKLQVSITGFLESSTPVFMAELWTLLLSAQESVGGIPKEFVEKKKEEMRLARERDAAAIRAAGQGANRLPGRPSSSRGGFRDQRGNVTERSRDAGWGSRRGRDTDEPDERPVRYDDGQRHRGPVRGEDRYVRPDRPAPYDRYERRSREDEEARRRPSRWDQSGPSSSARLSPPSSRSPSPTRSCSPPSRRHMSRREERPPPSSRRNDQGRRRHSSPSPTPEYQSRRRSPSSTPEHRPRHHSRRRRSPPSRSPTPEHQPPPHSRRRRSPPSRSPPSRSPTSSPAR
ncbi:unnamed protein product [Parajaminaea phylloscopi]